MIARKLKGLEDHISMSHVDTLLTKEGWSFSEERPDPLHPDTKLLRQLYGYAVEGTPSGKGICPHVLTLMSSRLDASGGFHWTSHRPCSLGQSHQLYCQQRVV